jgi:hypothetical protein
VTEPSKRDAKGLPNYYRGIKVLIRRFVMSLQYTGYIEVIAGAGAGAVEPDWPDYLNSLILMV